MEKIIDILADILSDVDVANEKHLVDNNILDSFDILQLVSELNDAFDVEITVEDLIPENFNSVEQMWSMIQRLSL